jgi:hypothetical protein
MKVKYNDPNAGTWFPFNENNADDGRIKLRVMNPAARKRIRGKAITPQVEYKAGKRYTYDEINEELYDRLMWDYIIIDWEKLEDDDGNPIECNAESKAKLMNEELTFAAFVTNCLAKIDASIDAHLEDSEKN